MIYFVSATTGINWYKLNWPFQKTHPDCLRWRFQKKNLNFVVQKFKSFIFNFFFEYLPKYIFHQRFRFALLFLYKTTKVLKEGLKSKKLSLNQLRWQEFSNRLLVSNFDVIVYYMHVITSFFLRCKWLMMNWHILFRWYFQVDLLEKYARLYNTKSYRFIKSTESIPDKLLLAIFIYIIIFLFTSCQRLLV